jgi:hypothetical protein
MSRAPLICLVTPGHVSTTPRLVKNADALSKAGYRVHVVAGAPSPQADSLDRDILENTKWDYTRVNTRTGAGVILRKIGRLYARRLVLQYGASTPSVSEQAHYAHSRRLSLVAARIGAQLYIGHCLAALPVAASAAKANSCGYAFDIEDYHDAETDEALADKVEVSIRSAIQRRLLPPCRPLLSASPLITEQYKKTYDVSATTLLNVFPLSDAPRAEVPRPEISAENPAVFYWFSQTIGPGRGLEAAIAVLGSMRVPAELHLRGFVAGDYSARLQALASQARLARPIKFLTPGPPGEMARLAANADVGLSIEQSTPLNRDICLTNKIFVYLLAGIPQVMSTTTAQLAFSRELGEAAIPCNMAAIGESAAKLDAFLSDHARVLAARECAVSLSRQRYCWDIESQILLRLVAAALPPTP